MQSQTSEYPGGPRCRDIVAHSQKRCCRVAWLGLLVRSLGYRCPFFVKNQLPSEEKEKDERKREKGIEC